MTVYYIFVIIGLLVALVHLMNERMAAEHFDTNKNRASLILSKCTPPNRWIRAGGCWRGVFWNKKKTRHIVQKRCNLRCGMPNTKPRPVVVTKPRPMPDKPSNYPNKNPPMSVQPVLPTPTTSLLTTVAFRDDKHRQMAIFMFDSSFTSSTLNFNDAYNRVELLGGGSVRLCICESPNVTVCEDTLRHCVTLNADNPIIDFDKTERNYLGSIRVLNNMGDTRVRLSNPRAGMDVPKELIVKHADKLAWNEAISSVGYDDKMIQLTLYTNHDQRRWGLTPNPTTKFDAQFDRRTTEIEIKPLNMDKPGESLPTKPSDVPTGSAPPQSEIKFTDAKHKQDASFVLNGSFHTPTLNFNDTYNKVELLGGGSAKVCSKNYNELCKGTNDKVCTRTMKYCVTLDENNPTVDFRTTEHKIGSRIKNDLSSVRIIDDTGSTRVRLSEPTTKRPDVPKELVVRNADKLAWDDAVSSVDFENNKYRLSLWSDDNFRGRNETPVEPGDLKYQREAKSIQVYMED